MITVIDFITEALGDNIAFSPYADLYQEKYGGKVYVKTKWYKLFYSENPNVYFVDKTMDIKYNNIIPVDFFFVNKSMQQLMCDQIGVEYKEIIPKIKQNSKFSFNKKKKYVCIAMQSTAQMKYWNNSKGWDKVVRFLKKRG